MSDLASARVRHNQKPTVDAFIAKVLKLTKILSSCVSATDPALELKIDQGLLRDFALSGCPRYPLPFVLNLLAIQQSLPATDRNRRITITRDQRKPHIVTLTGRTTPPDWDEVEKIISTTYRDAIVEILERLSRCSLKEQPIVFSKIRDQDAPFLLFAALLRNSFDVKCEIVASQYKGLLDAAFLRDPSSVYFKIKREVANSFVAMVHGL